SVVQEAQENEVTIPTVHLIESSARDNVGMRQIQEPFFIRLPVFGQRKNRDLPELGGCELIPDLILNRLRRQISWDVQKQFAAPRHLAVSGSFQQVRV